jgi:hypothetical protein
MSIAVTLFAIGVLLVASLVFLLFGRGRDKDDVSWPPEGSSALPPAQLEDCRKKQINQIFGREDWDFIRTCTPEPVQRLFLKERKGIALSWLAQLRKHARTSMHLHLATARASEELEPLAELKLAIDYYAFLAKCELIAAILRLGGPMALRDMVGQAESLSNSLRGVLEAAVKSHALSQKTGIR